LTKSQAEQKGTMAVKALFRPEKSATKCTKNNYGCFSLCARKPDKHTHTGIHMNMYT